MEPSTWIYLRPTFRIVAGITVFIILLCAVTVDAKTLTVNASGGADYTRIQDAINNANARDMILVYSDVYYENVDVNKQLIMKGIDNNVSQPVVNANGTGSPITLSAGNSTLDGFTAINAGGAYNAGIRVISNNNIIINNNISGSILGIFLGYSNNNILSGNNALNNIFGIYMYISSRNTLSGNNASKNEKGIFMRFSSNNILTDNMMSENKYNFELDMLSAREYFDNQIDTSNLVNGKPIYYIKSAVDAVYNSSINAGTFYCIDCVNVTLKDMNLNNNDAGIYFWNTTYSRIINVDTSNNNEGIALGFSSNNILSGNNISKNGNGIYLFYSSNNLLNSNTASNNIFGIHLSSSNNNMLSGNNASKNWLGISLFNSNNSELNGNTASNNIFGINLHGSINNTLTNNIMSENKYNFDLFGIDYPHFDNQIDISNLVNEKPIYYIKGAADTVYDSSTKAGTFYCINCVNVTLKDMNLNTNSAGIFLWNTTGSRIQNITASKNANGFNLLYSSNNTLSGNTANSNDWAGIFMRHSSNNIVNDNTASNNNDGISLFNSNNNTLSGNTANSNNWAGISMRFSGNNTVSGNTASNSQNGIVLFYYNNNNEFYNNFFKNTNNFYFAINDSANKWNITEINGSNIIGGSHLGGNAWINPNGTGFSQTCIDSDNNGICDSPYILDSNNVDHLPLAYKVPTVIINLSGVPIVNKSTKDILSVEYWNLKAGDSYNISITRMNDNFIVYINNGILKGEHIEITPINWTPIDTIKYLVEAKGKTTVNNKIFSVYDSEVITPIPELSTITFTLAGLLGLFALLRQRKRY